MTSLQLNIDAPESAEIIFVDVALPLPIPQLYTYRVPQEFNELVTPGIRVIVQFGRQKVITGIIDSVHKKAPEVYAAKPLLDILDLEPVVTNRQVELMKWVSNYYMSTYGEVINAALPSGLKLSSESKIQLHPDYDWHDYIGEIDDNELLLLQALDNNDALSYREAADAIALKSAYRYIKSLVQKELVIIYEEVKERYKPKKEKRIKLHETFLDEEALESLFKSVEKYPKQTDILLRYLQQIPIYEAPSKNEEGILKKNITEAGLSASSLNTLIKKEIIVPFERVISRFEDSDESLKEVKLSEKQESTKEEIEDAFAKETNVLLHGITGSGKTEIYISLIQSYLSKENRFSTYYQRLHSLPRL